MSQEPGRPTFSTYCVGALQRRTVDWQRKRFGRTIWKFHGRKYRREQPVVVPLDDRLLDDQLARSGDPGTDRSPDLLRLLGNGSSTVAGHYEALGLDPPERTPRRTKQRPC
jgi:hypothetical protein